MLCERCKIREATGVLINLCDPCFDEWEFETKEGKIDIGPVDPSVKYQRGGGLVPDDVKGVKLRKSFGKVKVDFVR